MKTIKMLPASERPVLACVGDRVFQVRNGSVGSIEVLSAGLSGDFELVTASNAPSNRFNQCCTQMNENCFLMLGGDGHGILAFEVWLFNTSLCEWRRLTIDSDVPLPRRSSHCAASFLIDGVCTVFVFGGVHGIELCRDALVLRVYNDSVSITTIPEGDCWPCPRRNSSLALCQSKAVLFGGENADGECLNDLWEFDASLFAACPTWRSIVHVGPSPRRLHQSWSDGQKAFVAGGVGPDGPLNDIWMWHEGAWQQTMIFVTTFPIFACNLGLCEVSEKLEIVQQKSPFAALDSLFEDLRRSEKQFSERRAGEEKKLALLRAQLNERRSQGAALDAYTGGEVTGNVKEALANFSQERREFLQAQIDELRTEIKGVVKEIVDEYPNCVRSNISSKRSEVEIAAQVALSRDEAQQKEKEIQSARYLELQLGEAQIATLRKDSSEEDVVVDPADFKTFMKLANQYGIMSEKSQAALDEFYRMQLRAYHHLLTKVASRKEELAEAQRKIPILEQKIARLSSKLSRRFARISLCQAHLSEWTKLQNDAKQQEKLSQQFLAELEQRNDENESQKQSENEATRERISEALVDIAQTNKEVLEALWKKAHEIMAQIDEQPPAVAATTLSSQAHFLEELIHKITHV